MNGTRRVLICQSTKSTAGFRQAAFSCEEADTQNMKRIIWIGDASYSKGKIQNEMILFKE